MRRIITREVYKNTKYRAAAQDGNREFITLIIYIQALGITLPPTLLYKGRSRQLQDTWVNDLGLNKNPVFSITKNGWTNNAYSIKWLKEVFELTTRPIRATIKRLLIINGHSSHINLRFINLASYYSIIILILPPHSIHRLQPLNMNYF